MDVNFDGRVVLVTGGSRGIGAATAVRFAELGAKVVTMARSAGSGAERVVEVRVDLTDSRAREAALASIVERHGVPDVVVNNAGTFLMAPLAETTDSLLREQLAVNLEAPFAVARRILPMMRERGAGRHILVGSIADHRAFPDNTGYSASKFGARGMHEVLVEEFRGTGVQCTLVSPGPTDTGVWDPIDPDNREGFVSRAAMLRPEDVADAIVWSASRPVRSHIEMIRLGPGA